MKKLLLSLMFVPFMAFASYKTISSPVPVQEADKVEVIEFFWYGCGYCYQVEAPFTQWKNEAPSFVNVRLIPLIIGDALWDIHAKFFVTLEAMGIEKDLRKDIFNEIHQKKRRLSKVEDMQKLVDDKGFDGEEFVKTFNSFAVANTMKQYANLALSYKSAATPDFIVHGKYRIDNNSETLDELTRLTNQVAAELFTQDAQ